MGNSLRCCLACVLPCGALDLIRIVHLNGFVEEITGPITAGEFLKANPNHILTKSCAQGVIRRVDIISADFELKRGSIYFLIPATTSSMPTGDRKKAAPHKPSPVDVKKLSLSSTSHVADDDSSRRQLGFGGEVNVAVLEKKLSSSRRERRRSGRVGVWRPHLRSISED